MHNLHHITSESQVREAVKQAARRFAERRIPKCDHHSAAGDAIELLITGNPSCPKWASIAVDQLLVGNEQLRQMELECLR